MKAPKYILIILLSLAHHFAIAEGDKKDKVVQQPDTLKVEISNDDTLVYDDYDIMMPSETEQVIFAKMDQTLSKKIQAEYMPQPRSASSQSAHSLISESRDGGTDQSLKVYPNPAATNSKLILNLSGFVQPEVIIMSYEGKIVYKGHVPENYEISTASFAGGLYTLIVMEGTKSLSKSVIITE